MTEYMRASPLTEGQLKRQISEYLQYGTNQGRWYADRLNSGEVIVIAGQSRRRVKLCREGTADFYIIQKELLSDGVHATRIPACRIIFLELKGARGKTSPAQNAFKLLVEGQGASYFVIHSMEELEVCLGYHKLQDKLPSELISDGFGTACSAYCNKCGEKTMYVVRPGDIRCSNCD